MSLGLHLGNILFLFAYLVRDILWLRILTVVATLGLMQYYFCCNSGPLYGPLGWNMLFVSVNLFQIGLLIRERRPVLLDEEELRIYHLAFQSLSPREFLKLIALANRKSAVEGETLLQQHESIKELVLITQGRGRVQVDGRYVAEVHQGQFVGEMGFLTAEKASASVIASLAADYLAWPVDRLRTLFAEDSQLHVKFQGILGNDLVEKLRQEGFASAHPSKIMGTYQRGEET